MLRREDSEVAVSETALQPIDLPILVVVAAAAAAAAVVVAAAAVTARRFFLRQTTYIIVALARVDVIPELPLPTFLL